MLSTTLSSTVISSGSERRSLSDFLKVVSPIRKVDKPRLFWVQSIFLDPVIALHSSSPKMTLLTRRPLELCALFLSLTVFAVSAGNSGSRSRPSRSSNLNFNGARPLDSIEARMLQQARDSHIRPIFQRARAQWYSYTSGPTLRAYPGIPDFQLRALEMANTHGATFVGVKEVQSIGRPSRNRRVLPSQNREIYFYSVVTPQSALGQQMDLHENNRIATALWKYNTISRVSTLLHVDELPYGYNLQWGLHSLQSVIESHSTV